MACINMMVVFVFFFCCSVFSSWNSVDYDSKNNPVSPLTTSTKNWNSTIGIGHVEDGTLVLSDGKLILVFYYSSRNMYLVELDLDTGNILSKKDITSSLSKLVASSGLYHSKNELYALFFWNDNPSTIQIVKNGKVEPWKFEFTGVRKLIDLTFLEESGDLIYKTANYHREPSGYFTEDFYCADMTTGEIKWKIEGKFVCNANNCWFTAVGNDIYMWDWSYDKNSTLWKIDGKTGKYDSIKICEHGRIFEPIISGTGNKIFYKYWNDEKYEQKHHVISLDVSTTPPKTLWDVKLPNSNGYFTAPIIVEKENGDEIVYILSYYDEASHRQYIHKIKNGKLEKEVSVGEGKHCERIIVLKSGKIVLGCWDKIYFVITFYYLYDENLEKVIGSVSVPCTEELYISFPDPVIDSSGNMYLCYGDGDFEKKVYKDVICHKINLENL